MANNLLCLVLFMGEDVVRKVFSAYFDVHHIASTFCIVRKAVLLFQGGGDRGDVLDNVVEEPAFLKYRALVHF